MNLLTTTSTARAIATKVVLGAGTLALLTCAVPTTASAQSRYYEPAYRGDQCVRHDRYDRYRTDYRTDYYVRERPRYVVREEPRYVVREPRYVVREEYVPARPYYRRDRGVARGAAVIGGSAVVGAGIGAAAGGGRGALIGGAIGAGAGAIINEVTRDHHHRYHR